MTDWNGFSSLDLTKVESSSGYVRLPKGEHHVKITDAVMKDSATGGKYLQVNFKKSFNISAQKLDFVLPSQH